MIDLSFPLTIITNGKCDEKHNLRQHLLEQIRQILASLFIHQRQRSTFPNPASIQSILDYLHDTPHFKKYNRTAYAFRVEEAPVVFITEKKNVEHQQYDGSHSDETIEGSGEKLLHLLEKFSKIWVM